MTIAWRRLEPAEPDHELIWAWVTIVSTLLAAVWLERFGLPPIVCPFHAVTGLPCLTCGATRALVALLHGEVAHSFRTNPLVPAAAAALTVYVPYALTVAHLGLLRLRLRFGVDEWLRLRWLTAAGAATLWIYLIVDGR